ncbi:MAG: hypothetical protein AAGC60_19165 [Acidobacteriota bacterium]
MRLSLPLLVSQFRGLRVLATAATLLLLAVPISAAPVNGDEIALTPDGSLYRVLAGTHGELFGGADSTRVLALEIETADSVERLPVPGTESWRPEIDPQLVYDADADAALLVWRSGTAAGDASLFFVSYRAGTWSQPGQLRADGDVVFFAEAPTLAVSRDRFSLELDEGVRVTISGVVFHVVWQDQGHARYAPIHFIDGEPAGWSETMSLSAVLQQAHQAQPPIGGQSAPDLFAVEPADDGRRLLVTFADATYGRVGTVAVGLLPLDLAYLGDSLEQQILDHAGLYDPGDVTSFAGKIRGEIISTGHKSRTNPAIAHYLSAEIERWIHDAALDYGWDLVGLAAAARSRAVGLGSTVYATTTADPHNPGAEVLQLDLGAVLGNGQARDELAAVLDVEVRSDAPLPTTVADRPIEQAGVQTSADGRALALVVEDGDAISWAIHRGDAWSEARSLALGGSIDLDTARTLLRESLR